MDGLSPPSGTPAPRGALRLPPASPCCYDSKEMDGLSPPSATAAPRGALIVDPALDLRIDLLSEAGQVLAAAAVEVPVPDLPAFRLFRLAADRRGKAGEIPSSPLGQAPPEGVAEEIEAGALEVPPAVRVFAVHD